METRHYPEGLYCSLLGMAGGVKVMLVRWAQAQEVIPGFSGAGHSLDYAAIPDGEVWVEDRQPNAAYLRVAAQALADRAMRLVGVSPTEAKARALSFATDLE